jgi:hypothetical protein
LVGEGKVLVRRKGFWNSIPVCVLLRKNLQNSDPTFSITKIPLPSVITTWLMYEFVRW